MTDAERWAEIKKDPDRYARYIKRMRDYSKERRNTDPEIREKQIQNAMRYQRRKYRTDPDYRKKVQAAAKKWRDKNPEKVKEYNKNGQKSRICKILRSHGQEFQDDPDHLQTDFMIMLINRDDKR